MLNIHIRSLLICILFSWISNPVFAEQKGYLLFNGQYSRLQTDSEQSFTVYRVGPEEAKQAILLIHGWWGLNHEIEAWADQYAMAGYRVMAIDIYNCQVTKSPVIAKKYMREVKQAEANEKYLAAIKALSEPDRKIAVIGRSYGANQALHATLVAQERVSATIVYYPYGELVTDKNKLETIKTPILGHFARNDFFFSPARLTDFTSATEKSGLSMTVNMYEASHGFDKSTGNNFNNPAHKLAQNRTYQFLNKYLN